MGLNLTVFEGKALYEALREIEYDVGLRTVQRWIEGRSTPKAQDIAAIKQVVGEYEKAAPPKWAERLTATIEAIRLKDGITEEELGQAEADLLALRGLGTNGPRRERGSGGASGGSGTAK